MPDRCWAKFEFVAENEDELYFAVGEQIEILERDDAYGDGWWRGRTADGKEGLFPMSYITETEPVKAPAPAAPAAASIARTATPPSPTSPAVPLHRVPSPMGDGTMGKTITDINKAIDSVHAPDESDDDDYSMGIGHSTRAKLAEQAKLENDQRERERAEHDGHRRTSSGFQAHKGISGNPAGLVYSDESDDEDEVDREREPSLVPSSGFAALAAAAAGSAGAAASHMTGGLFTAPKEDVGSPRAQVVDMPSVTEEAAPPATTPGRRGSFGQRIESPAVDQERPLSTVGLAITTDGNLPPPPSAPESIIERSEPPERASEVAAAPEPAVQDPGSEKAPETSEPLAQQPVAQVDETPTADTASAQNSVPEDAPKIESAPVSERVTTPEAEPTPTASSPPSVLAATPISEVPVQVQDKQSNGGPAVSPAILAPAILAPAAVIGAAAAVHSSPTSDTHARDAPATPAFISLASPPRISSAVLPSAQSPVTPAPTGSPTTWSVAQVVDWARSRGFDDAVCSKFQEHEISGDLLLELDANLLKELEIPQFGKRLRIAQAIGELRGDRRTRPESFDRSASGSASPAALGDDEFGWHGSRKGSVIDSPIAPPIQEEGGEMVLPAPSVVSAHSRASSMPASPVTPVTKRSSSGSTYGHKKNKASVDKPPSERMSFFNVNRQRKPPPREDDVNLEKNKSLSRLGFSSSARASKTSTPASSPEVPSGPSPQRLSVTPAESVVDKIGKPDFAGYMKKKGERYNTWKLRYFVLRGPNLYYMRSEHEHRIKGHIDLTGHRVVVDENVHPGSYGFRVVGGAGEKEHAFSSSEQSTVREWMKALIKATIARDYSAPVVSSCNIPTIPLDEAQAMSPAPRPPSPTQRDATQRASRRENVNQLTPRDASVLMSLDGGLDSGHKRRVSGLGVPAAPPPRPSRELRRPSRPSIASAYEPEAPQEQELLQWVNANVPPSVRATAFPGSFTNGLVITRLAEQLSGATETTPDDVFAPMSNGAPSVDGLFAMMDTLIDHGFDTAGVSPGDVLGGDRAAIGRLLGSVRAYERVR